MYITPQHFRDGSYPSPFQAAWLGFEAAYSSARAEAIRDALEAVKGERLECHEGALSATLSMAGSDAAYSRAIDDAEKAVLALLSPDKESETRDGK